MFEPVQSDPSHNRWPAGLPNRVITQIPGQESIVFQQLLIQVEWHLQPDKLDQLVLAVSGWDPLTWDVFLMLLKEEGFQTTTLSWPSNLFALLAVESRRMSVIEICFLEIWVYRKDSKRTCYNCITLPQYCGLRLMLIKCQPWGYVLCYPCRESMFRVFPCWGRDRFRTAVVDDDFSSALEGSTWCVTGFIWCQLLPQDEHSCTMLHLFGAVKHLFSNIAASESFWFTRTTS